MIDQEGINSLNTGAPNITYTGNEGVKSPEQEQRMMMAEFKMKEYMEEFERVFPEMIPLRGTDEYNEDLENYFRGLAKGPIFPSPEDPVNPFGPKPIGPVLPDRQMAAFGGIMGLDQRRQYGFGSVFKKAINKVTKPFTKVAQKIVPKELAGPLRTIAPFLPPGYREAAYLAGTAKQKGRFNIGDLAFALAPYARFTDTAAGSGTFGTSTKFGFGTAANNPGSYGIRDLITGGEAGGVYEKGRFGNLDRKGILGKIKLGESDLGQYTDEFIFGKPRDVKFTEPEGPTRELFQDESGFSEYRLGENLPGQNVVTKATPGILGMGGEMSVLGGAGGAPGIKDSILGQKAFLKADGTPSLLKLGSWGVGIVSGIQAGKYADEQEAALAAEEALLATNQAASDAEVQAAREWAIATFGKMSVYADGGRINKNMGGEFNMPPAGLSSLQTQVSDVTPQGMELDLRGGGFIPIGKAEKADDVPARVSKNEFVFTADAVKAAGGGSVNKGAKRMYDTMKLLESQVG